MQKPSTDPVDPKKDPKVDPTTEESIKQGKEIAKVQQDQNTAPKEKKEADAEKDADKWRNEG